MPRRYPKTIGGGRHVVFGEATPVGVTPSAPWMQVCGSHHTFPRDLHLDKELGLRVEIIPELETLRVPGSHIKRNTAGETEPPPMALGSQCEITLTCRYDPSTATDGGSSFGVDVLVSPDGEERLRVGFTDVPIRTAAPGLRMFVNHTKCCNRNTDALAEDMNCNVTQNAPLPAIRAATNVTMKVLVDGGLIELYGMNAVALTAIAAPSPDVPPEERVVVAFSTGRTLCDIQGWKLSM